MPCPERGKRHGSRWRFPSRPRHASSRPHIIRYAYTPSRSKRPVLPKNPETGTVGRGLAKTSSHTQALLMQVRYLAGVETWPAGILPGSKLKRIIVPVSSQAIIHGRLGWAVSNNVSCFRRLAAVLVSGFQGWSGWQAGLSSPSHCLPVCPSARLPSLVEVAAA